MVDGLLLLADIGASVRTPDSWMHASVFSCLRITGQA